MADIFFKKMTVLMILVMGGEAQSHDPAHQCMAHIKHQERTLSIPSGLLTAIAKIESGRKHPLYNEHLPWPWAINVGGKGMYFKTQQEAVSHVEKLIREGTRNVDVGCMQINYHHHGHHFQNINQMFDPRMNVTYGARFLRGLKNEQGSWTKAVGLYHSATLHHQTPYKHKVYKKWVEERRRSDTFFFSGMSRQAQRWVQGQYTPYLPMSSQLSDKNQLNTDIPPQWD
jgi:hypothetical protein